MLLCSGVGRRRGANFCRENGRGTTTCRLFWEVNRDTFTAGVTAQLKTRDRKATGAAARQLKSQPPLLPPPRCVQCLSQAGSEMIRIMASLALPGNAATLLAGETAPPCTMFLPLHACPLPLARLGLRQRVPQRRNSPTAPRSAASGQPELHPPTPGSCEAAHGPSVWALAPQGMFLPWPLRPQPVARSLGGKTESAADSRVSHRRLRGGSLPFRRSAS